MSTVLVKTNPFKTVLGFATMVDSQGQPFHKSLGNAIEFIEGANRFGADVIRWYGSRSYPYENIRFGQTEADETRRKFFLMLWNTYSFFVTYANLQEWETVKSKNVLDEWILARLNQLIKLVTENLDKYDAFAATQEIEKFVTDLSTWYIRRSRDRMTDEFFSTCYEVLVTLSKLLAPFTPFVAEEMYKNLTSKESVHLESYPKADKFDNQLLEQMTIIRKICELGHAKRKELEIRVRQPLAKVTINQKLPESLVQLIKDELNVKEVVMGDKLELDTKLTPELAAEGKARDLVRDIQDARKAAECKLDEKVTVYLPDWPKEFEKYIKTATLAERLVKGASLRIMRP